MITMDGEMEKLFGHKSLFDRQVYCLVHSSRSDGNDLFQYILLFVKPFFKFRMFFLQGIRGIIAFFITESGGITSDVGML
jgi:hypothetical protein